MNDLRTAAQQALEACEQRLPLNGQAAIIDELNNLRAALAQQAEPVQEPVAYRHLHEDGWEYHDAPTGEDCAECQALYTAPPQRKPERPAPCPDCHGVGYDASGQLCACQENPSF